jgi:Glutathione-dependent formaldehyde-activating enzyme
MAAPSDELKAKLGAAPEWDLVDTGCLDGVDRRQHAFDLRPAGNAEEDLAAGGGHRGRSKGAAKEHWTTSEKGNRIARLFCEQCGTPLFAKNETHPELLPVKVGSLDDPDFFRPQANIWTESARPWHFLDAAIPQFERDPELGTTALFEVARSSLVRLGRVVGLLSKQSERRPIRMTG